MSKISKKSKRFALLVSTALCFICVVSAGASSYGQYELPTIAPFVKSSSNGNSVNFDKSDFIMTSGQDQTLDGIVISSLPDSSAGVLKFDGRELFPLEGIAAESLSHLTLTPASQDETSVTFAFYPVFEGICDACPESYVTVNFTKDAGSPPIAENMSFETYKNISICGKFKAIDPDDNDTITYQISQKPKLGDITIENDGFRYSPYLDKHGKDSFTYVATDGKGNCSEPALIEITVKNRTGKNQITYNDMSLNSAHYAAIKLAEANVITGEKIGECFFFNPDRPVTRSEFTTMAVSAAKISIPSTALNTGLSDDDAIAVWAKPYISAALKQGIVQGALNPDGSRVFMPDKLITRAEAAVILNNIANLAQDGRTVSFSDQDKIPVWAVQPAVNLNSVNIITPDETGAMNPNNIISRADSAEMLYAVMQIIDNRK